MHNLDLARAQGGEAEARAMCASKDHFATIRGLELALKDESIFYGVRCKIAALLAAKCYNSGTQWQAGHVLMR